MDNQLIKINVNEKQEQTISARELHKFLESGERYSKWFDRMIGYGFVAGRDFNLHENMQVQIEGDRTVERKFQDHALTLDMAKQLCMLARSERGKQARQYFIQVEKDWNSPEKVMARALFIAGERIEHLKEKLQTATAAAAVEKVANDKALALLITAAGQLLRPAPRPRRASEQPRREHERIFKIQTMPREISAAVDQKLAEGVPYQAIAAYINDMGYEISTQSLSRYWRWLKKNGAL
jgi:anti-repressor protein